jgi:protein-arginine kinase activator protein McsA
MSVTKSLEDRFYALVKAPSKAKRKCMKCGKTYKPKADSRRVCHPCAKINDRISDRACLALAS